MINLAITTEQAQALMQVIGEGVAKMTWPHETEDTGPLIQIAYYLQAMGIRWTDESSDVYVWSTESQLPESYGDPEYSNWRSEILSPIFKSEQEALSWIEPIHPHVTCYLFAHWGRGWMGPGYIWDTHQAYQEELRKLGDSPRPSQG